MGYGGYQEKAKGRKMTTSRVKDSSKGSAALHAKSALQDLLLSSRGWVAKLNNWEDCVIGGG